MIKKILIAEDHMDSRLFLRSILEAQEYEVTEAANGKIGLEEFEAGSFDLVLTDIRMPEMDGLTLLRVIHARQPDLPVIIISAYQEPEDIIEALRCGACDYITKPYEEEQVLESIKRVSRIIRDEIEFRFCLGFMTEEKKVFRFDGNPDYVNIIAKSLCRNLALLDLKSEMQVMQVSLIEALNNAIYHGNLEIPSSLKQKDDLEGFERFKQAANKIRQESPYRERKVIVTYELNKESVKFTIQDEGPGFNFKHLPDPLDPSNFLKPSGRGLLMIQTFCDDVRWNSKGNEITLTKYRSVEEQKKSENPSSTDFSIAGLIR